MQQYNVYAIGQPVLLEAFNTNSQGDPASPSAPQILLKLEGSTEEESLAVTESPVGRIFHELRVLTAGKYFYRINTSDDSLEHFFVVRASVFETPLP